jgi:hypothetical protein
MRPGYVDACGTRRRLEALAALGHTARTIGAHMSGGFDPSRALVCSWKHRNRKVIDARTAAEVTRVYELLRDVPGTNPVVRIHALRGGCVPPDAWAGCDVDDPEAVPDAGRRAA